MNNLVNYLFFTLVGYIFLSTSQSFAMNQQEENEEPYQGTSYSNVPSTLLDSGSVQQVNSTLYVAKQANDLYFVMEKLTADNRESWQNYASKQFETFHALKEMNAINATTPHETLQKIERLYPYLSKFKLILNDTGGLSAFSYTIKGSYHTQASRESSPTCETWIAYAMCSKEAPLTFYNQSALPHVEMVLTVMTEDQAPFTTHLGISRSLIYIQKHAEEKVEFDGHLENPLPHFSFHRNISVSLHAFAAKVTQILYPEKLYMITVPLPSMRHILMKALPKDAIWLGDNQWLEENNKSSGRISRMRRIVPNEENRAAFSEQYMNIIRKNYSPIELKGDPEYYLSKEFPKEEPHPILPDDFKWLLRGQKGNIVLELYASSRGIIEKQYMWFFNNLYMKTSEGMPYLTVDLAVLAGEFNKK